MKTTSCILLFFLGVNLNAQEVSIQTGAMKATVTHTFGYEEDGVERPYTVTIREKRVSTAKFDKEDSGKVAKERIPTPEKVAMLIGINNPNNSSDNRVIALKYNKNINDTFSIESTTKGFVINVNERKMVYTIGEGISFNNSSDDSFFDVDEFDRIE